MIAPDMTVLNLSVLCHGFAVNSIPHPSANHREGKHIWSEHLESERGLSEED